MQGQRALRASRIRGSARVLRAGARDHESRQGQEPVRRRRVLEKPRGVPPQPRRRVHGS